MTYYTLFSHGPGDERWALEFGSYDREDAQNEMEDIIYHDEINDGFHIFKIVETPTANQREIGRIWKEMNAKLEDSR